MAKVFLVNVPDKRTSIKIIDTLVGQSILVSFLLTTTNASNNLIILQNFGLSSKNRWLFTKDKHIFVLYTNDSLQK